VDIELRVVEGGMTIVLGPFSFASTTTETATGPTGDAINDAMQRARIAEGKETIPHSMMKGLQQWLRTFSQRATSLVTALMQGVTVLSVALRQRAPRGEKRHKNLATLRG
jgi:hypothetical protein